MTSSYPIHHTFAPHVDLRYVLATIAYLLTPWRWRRGRAGGKLAQELQMHLGGEVFLFASGREAMLALLRAMKITTGAEIVLQGYTCVVLPNAIHAAGGVPIYADIDPDTLNMTRASVEPLLSVRTRAIVCQHTFGIPAPVRDLTALAHEKRLLMVEDCAHILPDRSGPPDVGRSGDVVLLSFGRDKAISGITGGALIIRDENLAHAMRAVESHMRPLSFLTVFRLLCYPLLYITARPLYGLGIGKLKLLMARRIGLLLPILQDKEKTGTMDPTLHALPNACAGLALRSFKRLQAINDHRRALTAAYMTWCSDRRIPVPGGIRPDLPLQKFPIFRDDAEEIRTTLKQQNVHLDDGWTGCVICPRTSDQEQANYEHGTDPCAEMAGQRIFSLPTHPTMRMRQCRRLCALLESIGMTQNLR